MGKSIKGGAVGSALGSLGGAAAGAIGGIAGLFGGGGGGKPGPQLDMSRFDYKKDIDERTRPSREASLKLLTELQEQAAGRGPSLAEAQLKSATSRNLAQTLAAAQAARGGSPALQQRELQRAQTDTGRQLAEQSALARMQEQQAAQGQLAQLAIQQQAQDLSQVMGYANPMMAYEQMRFAQDVAKTDRIRNEQNALRGQLLGAGATIAGAMIGGPAGAAAGSQMGSAAGGGGGGGATPVFGFQFQPAQFPNYGKYAGGRVKKEDAVRPAGGMFDGGAVEPEDSPANDTVPAMLSPGEIVLPRSVATKKDAPSRAKKFVEALIKMEKAGPGIATNTQQEKVPDLLAQMQTLKAANPSTISPEVVTAEELLQAANARQKLLSALGQGPVSQPDLTGFAQVLAEKQKLKKMKGK